MWMMRAGWRHTPVIQSCAAACAGVRPGGRPSLRSRSGELGEFDSAISRLHALAASSDDPDYAAQLARFLGMPAATLSQQWRQLRRRARRVDRHSPRCFRRSCRRILAGSRCRSRQGAPIGETECLGSQYPARPPPAGAGRCCTSVILTARLVDGITRPTMYASVGYRRCRIYPHGTGV